MSSFTLRVRRPPPHTELSIEVTDRDTVADVAYFLCALATGALRLCFRGRLLTSGADTLGSLGITAKHFVVALFDAGPRLTWADAAAGAAPLGAVRAGAEADGTSLYLARAAIEATGKSRVNATGATPRELADTLPKWLQIASLQWKTHKQDLEQQRRLPRLELRQRGRALVMHGRAVHAPLRSTRRSSVPSWQR